MAATSAADIIVSRPSPEDRAAALNSILRSKVLPSFVYFGLYNGYFEMGVHELGRKIGYAMKRWPAAETYEQHVAMSAIGQILLDLSYQETEIENGDAASDREACRDTRSWLGYVETDREHWLQFDGLCEIAGLETQATLTMLRVFLRLSPGMIVNDRGDFEKCGKKRRRRTPKHNPLPGLFDEAA